MHTQVRETMPFNYTSLRLCDVMGPHDNIGGLLRLKVPMLTLSHDLYRVMSERACL